MPWEREDEMVLKTRFAHEFNAPNSNKSEICRRYGVSRDTGYRLARKYHQLGEAGLPRASSAPLTHPNEVSNEAIEHLLALRAASPGASWAATKLLRFWDETVARKPSRATVTRILNDYHLSQRYRMRPHKITGRPAPASCDNDVWAIDGKGLWHGVSPLSVLDVHSRFLLALEDVSIVTENVQRITGRLFDQFGQPRRIRCDGGSPFGGKGVAQLSRLALWWIDLGIVVEHVSKPQHNGHLERLHRTMEQEAPDDDVRVALRVFRDTYNDVRPHESLNGATPGEVYAPTALEPHSHIKARFDDERYVRTNGYFKWRGDEIFLSEALATRTITFRLLEEDLWLIRYRHMPLVLLDDRARKLRRCPRDVFDNFT